VYKRQVVSEPDTGQSEALNKGLRLIHGDVFNWLNSDDLYAENALARVGEHFEDPSVQILCGRSVLFGLNQKEKISSGTDIYPLNLPKTIGWARLDQPETFFRKPLVDAVGGLDERLHFVMDRHLWIKILLVNGIRGIKQIDRVLVRFRLHPDSKTVSNADGFHQENRQLFAGLLASLGFAELVSGFLGDPSIPFLDGLFDDLRNRHDRNQIAAYVLLHAFLMAYADNDWSRARWLSDVLDPVHLALADRLHYFQVRMRMKFVPVSLKRFWNGLRG
jgi:hypothetical protein